MNDSIALVVIVLSVLIPLFLAAAVIIKTARDGSLGEDVDYVRYVIRNKIAQKKYASLRNH